MKKTIRRVVVPRIMPKVGPASGNADRGTIVVPIDFSHASKSALEFAIRDALSSNRRILLVHVLEAPVHGFMEASRKEEAKDHSRATAERKLREMAAFYAHDGLVIDYEVRTGLPEYEILKAAEETRPDVIVIGRNNRGFLSRLVFGSVTDNVVHGSTYPVMVLNPKVK